MKKAVVTMLAIVVAAAFVLSVETGTALARPQYKTEFDKKYMTEGSALQKAIDKTNCNICHQGKDRKNHNDYGKALKKLVGEEKNVKDTAKINEVFEKGAKEKSTTEGKTYGDLIKEGKLKLTTEEPK